MASNANKTIAKNTLFLYGRKAFTLVVALYISRLLLQRLGITDFGIYGLVGSVVAMFSALRGIFSTSIQRFINIAKGKGNEDEVNEIFSLGLKIHVWIAVLFLVIVEIGGTIMMHYLDIPKDKFLEAYIVLQFSLLTAIVTILTVPYDALIIANEKFNAYAIFSIIDATLKLLLVILLMYSPISRLVAYAGLLFIISLLIRSINAIYCRRKFGEESRYTKVNNNKLLKEMTEFAGWQFLGNTAYTLSQNGINLVINIMGGVVVNAARTIAYQAMHAITQFTSDLNLSFQPRTMMNHAQGNHKQFYRLLFINSKANFAISIILAFVIFILAEPIIKLWLGKIPPYSVGFVRAIMIYLVIRSLHAPLDLFLKSCGNIRDYQITEICILTLSLPLSWILLRIGFPFYSVFLGMAFCELLNTIAIIILAKHKYGFEIIQYCRAVAFRVIACFTLMVFIGMILISNFNLDNISYIRVIIYSIILFCGSSIVIILTMFSRNELFSIFQLINSIKRLNK